MEFTKVGVPAAKALRGTIDRTAVAPANAAVRRMKARRCIKFARLSLFEGVISLEKSSAVTLFFWGVVLAADDLKWKRDTTEFARETQSFSLDSD
jgi:hypothetical protein